MLREREKGAKTPRTNAPSIGYLWKRRIPGTTGPCKFFEDLYKARARGKLHLLQPPRTEGTGSVTDPSRVKRIPKEIDLKKLFARPDTTYSQPPPPPEDSKQPAPPARDQEEEKKPLHEVFENAMDTLLKC